MSEPLPSVSVIIAARPEQAEIQAVAAACRLDYPPNLLEIIVARGNHPSVQRNAALKAAAGDWVYFLDDDAIPLPENLRRASKAAALQQVKMIGGPNLCPPEAPELEQVFAVVLASGFAFGPSRARYASVGLERLSSEKELILCNLLARRADLLELGGFNEALYPNEENALMDDLQNRGGQLRYDPQFIVHRRPRHSLGAFFRMLRTYGRGRAEQFRVRPTLGSALNFVPPIFCVYLFSLAVFQLAGLGKHAPAQNLISTAPLLIYVLAMLVQTFVSMPAHGVLRSLLATPLLMATHVLYGLGFWHGLFAPFRHGPRRPKLEVRLEFVRRG